MVLIKFNFSLNSTIPLFLYPHCDTIKSYITACSEFVDIFKRISGTNLLPHISHSHILGPSTYLSHDHLQHCPACLDLLRNDTVIESKIN